MLRRPLTALTIKSTELDDIFKDCDANKGAHDEYENPFYLELMVWVDQLHKLQIVPKWLPSKQEILNMGENEMQAVWLRVGCIVEDFTPEQEARLLQDTTNPTPEDVGNSSAGSDPVGPINPTGRSISESGESELHVLESSPIED